MTSLPRIRIPMMQRWHRFRQQVLPVLSFVACVAFTLWLWDRQAQFGNGVGVVEALRADVAAGGDGLLVSHSPLPPEDGDDWTLFDTVQQGELIARLDDRPLRASLATMQTDLVRIRSLVAATETQLVLDQWDREHQYGGDVLRLAFQMINSRLDILDRDRRMAVDEMVAEQIDNRLEQWDVVANKSYVSPLMINENRIQLVGLRDGIKDHEAAREFAMEETSKVRQQLDSYLDGVMRTEVDKILAPLETAIKVQEATMEELLIQIESLSIRAPFSGTITAIHSRPGQSVQLGAPIVTIASNRAGYLVSYVRQDQRIRPIVGMKVKLRTRHPGSPSIESEIQRVGPQVEPVPPHHLGDPTMPEWGLPVRIRIPEELDVRPGQLLDIIFPPSHRQAAKE